MEKDREVTFEPDYDKCCDVCDSLPTVVILEGDIKDPTYLCGPCFFGEADMLNSDNWNN